MLLTHTVFYAFILWENITSIYWKPMNLDNASSDDDDVVANYRGCHVIGQK